MNYYYPARPTANSIDCVLDFDSKLYIGDAQAFAHYQHYGIQAIISFSTEQQFLAQDDAEQMVLQVNDRPQCDILSYFEKTNKFISKHMDANHNVLVHCVAGKSRSATIVLAYLMYSQEWSLQDALTYLKSVRSIISPNPGFIRQLLKYEQKLLGCTKSNLTSEITPYYSVQKADTIIPEGPAVSQFDYGTSSRRSSYASPPPMMNQRQYQTMQYGWRYY